MWRKLLLVKISPVSFCSASMHCGRMCACLATRFLRLALRPRNLPPKRRVGTIFVKNWYWLGGHLRAQLRGGGSMPIFAVGPRRNRVYTQAREPALYCCLRPEISPAAKCWPELRCMLPGLKHLTTKTLETTNYACTPPSHGKLVGNQPSD